MLSPLDHCSMRRVLKHHPLGMSILDIAIASLISLKVNSRSTVGSPLRGYIHHSFNSNTGLMGRIKGSIRQSLIDSLPHFIEGGAPLSKCLILSTRPMNSSVIFNFIQLSHLAPTVLQLDHVCVKPSAMASYKQTKKNDVNGTSDPYRQQFNIPNRYYNIHFGQSHFNNYKNCTH